MKPALELTSVPDWVASPAAPDADLSGRSWTIIALGPSAVTVVDRWTTQIAAASGAVRVHRAADDAAARQALSADLTDAVVGWRLMIAGPADSCLRLRAFALNSGVADDEITVASTETTIRDVHCVHCRTVTRAAVAIEDVLPCAGCGRDLLVYYHVSRRLGAHLGFMVDAERPAASVAS